MRYFVAKYLEIELEAHEAQKQTLCSDGLPLYRGTQNFSLLNQFEDVPLTIYKKHYFLALEDLQTSGLYDLEKVIEDPPMGFTVLFEDHTLEHWGSVDRIYEAAKVLCASEWGVSINK